MMDSLPISVRITDGSILLVGGGREASHKAAILNRFTDKVTVIADSVSDDIQKLPFRIIRRAFVESDLDGVRLLFVCTGDNDLNHRIKAIAERKGILTSVCDDPSYCDFTSPAVSRQDGDNLAIAVSSDARDVHRSIRVRNRINKLISEKVLDIK